MALIRGAHLPLGSRFEGKRLASPASLELQLQCELDLPSRPEVSRGEPRALDDPEGTARRRQHCIAKIRMVEDVEHLRAELQVEPLGYPRVFRHRKIGVREVWSHNRISSERPGTTRAGNDGVDLKARRRRVRAQRNVAERARYRKRRIRRGPARRNRGCSSGRRPVERLTQRGVAEILRRTARSGNALPIPTGWP